MEGNDTKKTSPGAYSVSAAAKSKQKVDATNSSNDSERRNTPRTSFMNRLVKKEKRMDRKPEGKKNSGSDAKNAADGEIRKRGEGNVATCIHESVSEPPPETETVQHAPLTAIAAHANQQLQQAATVGETTQGIFDSVSEPPPLVEMTQDLPFTIAEHTYKLRQTAGAIDSSKCGGAPDDDDALAKEAARGLKSQPQKPGFQAVKKGDLSRLDDRISRKAARGSISENSCPSETNHIAGHHEGLKPGFQAVKKGDLSRLDDRISQKAARGSISENSCHSETTHIASHHEGLKPGFQAVKKGDMTSLDDRISQKAARNSEQRDSASYDEKRDSAGTRAHDKDVLAKVQARGPATRQPGFQAVKNDDLRRLDERFNAKMAGNISSTSPGLKKLDGSGQAKDESATLQGTDPGVGPIDDDELSRLDERIGGKIAGRLAATSTEKTPLRDLSTSTLLRQKLADTDMAGSAVWIRSPAHTGKQILPEKAKDIDVKPIPVNEEGEEDSEHRESTAQVASHKKHICIGASIVVAVILAITIPLVLMTKESNNGTEQNDEGDTTPNNPCPTDTPHLVEPSIFAVLNDALGDSSTSLTDPSTPQHRALNWIVCDDQLNLSSDAPNLLQRYTLMAFHFSAGGDDWNVDAAEWGAPDLHECDWGLVDCATLDPGRRGELRGRSLQRHQGRLELDAPTRVVTGLRLGQKGLSGTVVPEIGQLFYIEHLELPGNEIGGSLPDSFSNLSNMRSLNLYSNHFSGEFFNLISSMVNLEHIDIASNEFQGPIPTFIDDISRLGVLIISENDISGNIPTEIGALSLLGSFHATGSKIGGDIPTEIGSLSNLASLELKRNKLNGKIPTQLGDLGALSNNLDLSENNLGGEIPTELGNLNNLSVLSLYSNDLTGKIPPHLGNMTTLTKLDLKFNGLNGSIPVELGKLQNLETLDLKENYLIGYVPEAVCKLTESRSLSEVSVGCDVACNCCNDRVDTECN